MSRYLRAAYQTLDAYTPGEQPQEREYIKLNTNESPYPPAPGVARALARADARALRLYPDPTGSRVKAQLAARYGVEPANVFLSNGSDDILNFAFMAYNDPGARIAYPSISYSFYPVIAALHGLEAHPLPLGEDMRINPADYCGLEESIVIPNPNAPTGIALPLPAIEEILRTNPQHVVLIDEAYVDFGTDSAVSLVQRYDNLIVSQTFSKSRSFAGGRLGYAIACEALIADLMKIQYSTNPYNVNRLTLLLAEATLAEEDYYRENARQIRETRQYTVEQLSALGFTVLPSQANFVFAKTAQRAGGLLYEQLKERGILVRHFSQPEIADYLRITIGTREQMDALLEALRALLQN